VTAAPEAATASAAIRAPRGHGDHPDHDSGESPGDPDSDAAVIAASLHDPEAFAVLFDRYADDIHRYAAARLGTQAADDVMAETFVAAFQRRRRYDLERPRARPWLYGIATNLIARHRRTEARRLRALTRLAPEDAATGEPLADRVSDRVSAQASRAALAAALAGLPRRYRDTLLVVAWGGLDYAEAADALGVPVGTVRSRLHRARARLRTVLGGTDPTAFDEDTEEHDHA
jgi:RNA polymerase sigma-70 factor (ECF subfamily)